MRVHLHIFHLTKLPISSFRKLKKFLYVTSSCILCILLIFSQVNSSLFYAASSYSCYMGELINAEQFKLVQFKKNVSDDSIFDGSCLHDLYVYCVNVGQDQ